MADVHIHPPVEGYGAFEWHRYPEFIALGYHAARQALEEWKRNPSNSRLAELLARPSPG